MGRMSRLGRGILCEILKYMMTILKSFSNFVGIHG